MAVVDALRAGAASAADALARSGFPGVDVGLVRVSVCTLSNFPEQAIMADAEVLASVRLAWGAPPIGVGILALEPRAAWRLLGVPPELWRGSTAAEASLRRHLELGASLLSALASPLGPLPGPSSGPERFEGPVVAGVLGTHAAPDTRILSAEIVLALGAERIPGFVYLLYDAKSAAASVDAASRA